MKSLAKISKELDLLEKRADRELGALEAEQAKVKYMHEQMRAIRGGTDAPGQTVILQPGEHILNRHIDPSGVGGHDIVEFQLAPDGDVVNVVGDQIAAIRPNGGYQELLLRNGKSMIGRALLVRPGPDLRPREEAVRRGYTQARWSSDDGGDYEVFYCDECGGTSTRGHRGSCPRKHPQRPQPDELTGTGHLRKCRNCNWQGRSSKTITLSSYTGSPPRKRCPDCQAGTKRVWRGQAAIQAELGSLGTLDPMKIAEKTVDRHTCDCPVQDDDPCEFHPDNYFCHEHGWCDYCAANAADPASEALKRKLDTPLPEVENVTDELIEQLDVQLREGQWPGMTSEQRGDFRRLFNPYLVMPPPPLQTTPLTGPTHDSDGRLRVVGFTAVDDRITYHGICDGIDLPESAEANYKRLTAERKAREAKQQERAPAVHRNTAAETECLAFGHVEVVGHDHCFRCKLSRRDQELLRARFLDTEPQAW